MNDERVLIDPLSSPPPKKKKYKITFLMLKKADGVVLVFLRGSSSSLWSSDEFLLLLLTLDSCAAFYWCQTFHRSLQLPRTRGTEFRAEPRIGSRPGLSRAVERCSYWSTIEICWLKLVLVLGSAKSKSKSKRPNHLNTQPWLQTYIQQSGDEINQTRVYKKSLRHWRLR